MTNGDPPTDFQCVHCDERHPWKEVGFNWPDATLALSWSEEQKAELRNGDNEDTLVIEGRDFFIRGWAPVELKEGGHYGVGFWIQVAEADFEALQQPSATDTKAYAGRIANQDLLLAPTLGAAATVTRRATGFRPVIRFSDLDHPFARAQRTGVELRLVSRWLSDAQHPEVSVPSDPPTVGTLEADGWEVMDCRRAGKTPVEFEAPPLHGALVKVLVAFVGADAEGTPMVINAGWWVKIDSVDDPELWSGTLRNVPRVPSTLRLGSRLWFRPEHCFEHAPGE